MYNKKLVILSGGFDPLHEGHIRLFEDAKRRFDIVVVGLNSDEWLVRKKGKYFMSYQSRLSILEAIKHIDNVYSFDDSDNTANDLIKQVLEKTKDKDIDVYFGNGGDRSKGNYPELDFCLSTNVAVIDDLGGSHKANASSVLLQNWESKEVASRDWGIWKVLFTYSNKTKIKELIVEPGKSLSWQQHSSRSELWFIKNGNATLYLSDIENKATKHEFKTNSNVTIPVGTWHKVCNDGIEPLHIIEIQYGTNCIESDIIRKPFPYRSVT